MRPLLIAFCFLLPYSAIAYNAEVTYLKLQEIDRNFHWPRERGLKGVSTSEFRNLIDKKGLVCLEDFSDEARTHILSRLYGLGVTSRPYLVNKFKELPPGRRYDWLNYFWKAGIDEADFIAVVPYSDWGNNADPQMFVRVLRNGYQSSLRTDRRYYRIICQS